MRWTGCAMLAAFFAAISGSALGAETFQNECADGSYLTGFEGRAGAWIDKFTFYCARWDPKSEKLDEPVRVDAATMGTSDGGEPTSEHCPSGSIIAGRYKVNFSQWGDENHFLVHSIEFTCRSTAGAEPSESHSFGSKEPIAERFGDEMIADPSCPDGEFAAGLSGTHGLFVDTVAFVCRAAPVAVVVARPTDDMIKNDRLSTKPGNVGDMIGSATSTPPPDPTPPPPAGQTPPGPKTAKVVLSVDVYDVPGGGGKVIGALRTDTTVGLIECRADNWCHVTGASVPKGDGWVYSGPDYRSLQV